MPMPADANASRSPISPPFSAVPFPPIGSPGGPTVTIVGAATFAFSDGQTASFAYTVTACRKPKTIRRRSSVRPAPSANSGALSGRAGAIV